MASESLKRSSSQLPAKFDPKYTKSRITFLEAGREHAKRMKDWPRLDECIREEIEETCRFIDWWDGVVGINQSIGRGKKTITEQLSFSVEEAEKETNISAMQVSRWRNKRKDIGKWEANLRAVNLKTQFGSADTTALKWTGDPESYTPAEYIDAARLVMGAIDLDPASDELAQKTVRAVIWYGVKDDGLKKTWNGRVFLNPPYSFPEIQDFIDKLLASLEAGTVTQAILLTNNNTDTKWWHRAARFASAVCFTAGRINFYKQDGSITQPTNGQTFFYFGSNRDSFNVIFSSFGLVMEAI